MAAIVSAPYTAAIRGVGPGVQFYPAALDLRPPTSWRQHHITKEFSPKH